MSALAKVFKDPAKRAEFIFGQPMQPCPTCGSYNLRNQTPIVMDMPENATPKQMLGAWARATKGGATPLEGPVYLMCVDCRHKGPAVDCSGRTSEDVGQDPVVSAEMKRLWNEQTKVPHAYCCNGDPATCDCVNPDHSTAQQNISVEHSPE